MQCPACGHRNRDGSARCASCKRPFNATAEPSRVEVRLSRLALASTLCTVVLPVVPLLLSLVYIIFAGLFNLRTGRDVGTVPFQVIFLACAILLVVGFVLGVVALVRISLSAGRLTGHGFAVIGTVLPAMVALLALGLWLREVERRPYWYRIGCGTNLSGIGKAMLIYANDYDDKLPVAGGQGTVWRASLKDWRGSTRQEAFGLDPNGAGGQATISSSLYLLVKYRQVSPKSFVCKGDRQTKQFEPHKYGIDSDEPGNVWDFGPDPTRHCSYAYHIPYGRYALTTSSHPGLALAADRNPWIDEPRQEAAEFSLFRPDITPFDGTAEDARRGNSRAHSGIGQNLLFLDTHVEFAQRSFCALRDDNVYTAWDGDDRARGVPPKPCESQPAHKDDSLLVNDPPVSR